MLFLSVVHGQLLYRGRGLAFDTADQLGVEKSEAELQRKFVVECEGTDDTQLQHVSCTPFSANTIVLSVSAGKRKLKSI